MHSSVRGGTVFISNDVVGGYNSEWLGGVGGKFATALLRLLIALEFVFRQRENRVNVRQFTRKVSNYFE